MIWVYLKAIRNNRARRKQTNKQTKDYKEGEHEQKVQFPLHRNQHKKDAHPSNGLHFLKVHFHSTFLSSFFKFFKRLKKIPLARQRFSTVLQYINKRSNSTALNKVGHDAKQTNSPQNIPALWSQQSIWDSEMVSSDFFWIQDQNYSVSIGSHELV